MLSLKNTVDHILQNKFDFCCLCFNCEIINPVNIEDEVIVVINGSESNVKLFEVLSTILDDQSLEVVNTLNSLCKTCTQTAVKSYVFIKTSKLNSELLSDRITGLMNSVTSIKEDLGECKTVFVSLNKEDFTSQQFYDTKSSVKNITSASKRFNSLIKAKTSKTYLESTLNKVDEKLDPEKISKKRSNCVVPMSTSEMLYDNNDNIIKCKDCLKVYSTMLNLRNHYIRVHSPKVFKCKDCPKRFGSPAFLEVHRTEAHSKYVCSECGKVYNNKHAFKLHESGHFMRIVCQDCGRVYKNKMTFKKHIEWNVCSKGCRASPADAKFTCDYCNKKYTQKVSLRVHIQYEHGNYKSHVCKHCDKKFWAQSRLKAHMVKHTKERKFKCNLCDGKYVTKESLLYHTRIHTGEKPYECPDCNARFLSASRRSEHVKRHHVNATLECDICGSKFNSHNYLHKHKKGHAKHVQESDQKVNKVAITQKISDTDLKIFTQQLKKLDNQPIKAEFQSNDEIFLEFTNDESFQFIQYAKPTE